MGAHIGSCRRKEVAGSPYLELSARGGHAADPDLIHDRARNLSSRVGSKICLPWRNLIGTKLGTNVAADFGPLLSASLMDDGL